MVVSVFHVGGSNAPQNLTLRRTWEQFLQNTKNVSPASDLWAVHSAAHNTPSQLFAPGLHLKLVCSWCHFFIISPGKVAMGRWGWGGRLCLVESPQCACWCLNHLSCVSIFWHDVIGGTRFIINRTRELPAPRLISLVSCNYFSGKQVGKLQQMSCSK